MKKIFKAILAISIIGAMALGFAACGGNGSAATDGGSGEGGSSSSGSGNKVVKLGVFEPLTGDSAAGGKKELLGIQYAPLWAMAVSVVDALPILGTGTVLVPWSLVCLVQHNTGRALGLVGLYIATALTRSTLEPRLVGRQLGLDPLVTLIALYVGFRLWGLPGMILSPLLVITLISMFPQVQAGQQ